jgi:phage tail-like protein
VSTNLLSTAFNFRVEVLLPGAGAPLCEAGFAECTGLEATAEVKTIREGGNNSRPIHLAGVVSYGQLELKRGMTSSFELWEWFDRVQRAGERHLRASCEVRMLSSDRTRDTAVFALEGCLPTKIKAPALNAKDGAVAIEELQIAYELLTLKVPGANGGSSA